MKHRSSYIFTNRNYSKKSIMSTVLGLIAVVSLLADIYFSYKVAGESVASYGVACLLALIYAATGMVLGVVSRMEQDKFYLFANIGIGLNLVALSLVSVILYAGIWVPA